MRCFLIQLAVASSLSGFQSPVPGQHPVTVEYLGNEGVLISHGQIAVLVDALFGDGLPDYPTVPRPLRDSVENALGRFAQVDLILVTHAHRDHFDASAVTRHLRANPRARFVAAPQAVSLVGRAGWTDTSRTTVIAPDPARPGRRTVSGVAIEGHGIPHAGIDHLVWVLELGGIRVMHAGDAEPSAEELRRAAGNGVDLLLTPWWLATGRAGPERIAATRASQVAAFHVGHSDRVSVPEGVTVLRATRQRIEIPTR